MDVDLRARWPGCEPQPRFPCYGAVLILPHCLCPLYGEQYLPPRVMSEFDGLTCVRPWHIEPTISDSAHTVTRKSDAHKAVKQRLSAEGEMV